jgi:hypothetical protein
MWILQSFYYPAFSIQDFSSEISCLLGDLAFGVDLFEAKDPGFNPQTAQKEDKETT